MKIAPQCVVFALLTALIAHSAPAQKRGQRTSRTTFTHGLPALDGAHARVDIVQVDYGPGAASPAHTHPCPVVGYVLSGAIRTQVKGEAPATFTAGQSFYEAPNGVHLISANASTTKPARLLAFFICDHEAELSTPVKGAAK